MAVPVSSDRRRGDRRDPDSRLVRLLTVLGLTVADLNPLHRSDRPDESFERQWRRVIQTRASVVLVALVAWGVVLQTRLVRLQVVDHSTLLEQAQDQQRDSLTLEPDRGSIVDRRGRLMAFSVDAESIAVHPRLVTEAPATVAKLCSALGDCTPEERTRLLRTFSARGRPTYVRRARAVLPEQVARVRALNLPGLQIQHDTNRFYPGRELAAHVLGFVSVDNAGLEGIEHTFDRQMRGREGRALVQVDAKRTRIDTLVQSDPEPGATVELTLDLERQAMVERELRRGVQDARAEAGTAIVMDTATGAVVAFANYPTFNPNEAWLADATVRGNRGTLGIYEPGSTFKIVTAAAALEERVVAPTDLIDTGNGSISFPGRPPIRDTHVYGVMTFEDVVAKSSNVGTIRVAQRLGVDRLTGYVHRFGFGQRLTKDFGAADDGLWNPRGLNESGLASVSIGYQIGVTPLQMITAVNAVANGGVLVEPRVVSAIVRNGRREEVDTKVVRRVVEPATAATLTAMLEGVVSHGTATAANVPGYMVAGKTGTSRKIVGRGYSTSDYNASFVGFVPSRRPEYTILVVIDTPKNGAYYGGSVAAPVFQRIAESLMLRDGVLPTTNPEPPLVVRRADPPAFTPGPRVAALLPAATAEGGPAVMPDVTGLSAREALAVLQRAGLYARIQGSGAVVRQAPAPGVAIELGSWGALTLSRRGIATEVDEP